MRRVAKVGTALIRIAVHKAGKSQKQSRHSSSSNNVDFGYKTVDANEKENLVKEVFSKVAQKYDVMNDAMSLGMHRLWKDCFVDMIGLRAASVADSVHIPRHLDVAGGTGDIAFRVIDSLFKYYPESLRTLANNPLAGEVEQADRQVVVCDINADMLRVGKARAPSAVGLQESNIVGFVEGNAEQLPFPDASFDLYTIAFGLRNVTDKQKALEDAFRVLRPGGRLMILEFSHLSNPVFQYAYDQYSFNIIPKLGELIANDAASYQYLVESIRKFPRQDELLAMVERAGFKGASYEDMQFGVVCVHSGYKL